MNIELTDQQRILCSTALMLYRIDLTNSVRNDTSKMPKLMIAFIKELREIESLLKADKIEAPQ